MRPEHSGKGESRGLETPSVVKEVKAGTSEIDHSPTMATDRQAGPGGGRWLCSGAPPRAGRLTPPSPAPGPGKW